jgi:hypothetical protein
METKSIAIDVRIDPSQEGTYFTQSIQIPAGVERFTLSYQYLRKPEKCIPLENGVFTSQEEENIVDLGLIDPAGYQVGASGSDKAEIMVSETLATPGYHPCPIVPGTWQILIGAYKIAAGGVTVHYKIHLEYKIRRLLKGDLHTHTLASDGVHSAEELAIKATRNGLDFLAITDHNQMVSAESLPRVPGLTLIPGLEWTHFKGHANFLGVDKPYDPPFYANSADEVRSRFTSAHERGALITINHPFEEIALFKFDFNSLPYDCMEIWNGPMRASNLKAIGLWQQLLVSGKKVPISAGSDYHRDTPFIFLGGPTMCVYSMSYGCSDILEAVRSGHGFITFAPNGPTLEMTAGSAIMGDSVCWSDKKEVEIIVDGLQAGDILRIISNKDSRDILEAKTDGKVTLHQAVTEPGFSRVEILRAFLPGLPMLPALVSNPIYFDA